VENRMGDLWSLFDFLNPGLLGSAKAFTDYAKRLADQPHHAYGPLRDLVRPYILRRLKTDRSIIQDLPDKVEVRAYCPLSKRQATLYQEAVAELTSSLDQTEGIQRKGIVLSALMRFKQICNHPSQWLGDGAWAEADSGKWERLRELAETISARQEKVLVFTQFREVTARRRRSHGLGQWVRSLPDQHQGRTGGQGGLGLDLPGLCRGYRIPGGTAPGAFVQRRHGAHLPPEDRPLPQPEGHHLFLLLPGLGFHVQACRGRALWCGRAAGP
jgi:hypothetical protein